MTKQIVIGHRGASGMAPENTLLAFQLAYELGAHMIETDVQKTEDGVLVCLHDYEVDHTTNGTGAVAELTFREIRTLDAGKGAKIPTLDEVLDFVRGKMKINIELKITEIEKEVLSAVREREMVSDVIISSFYHGTLIATKTLDDRIFTAILETKLREEIISYVIELEANALNPNHEYITPDIIVQAHSRDIQVFPWTVNDSTQIQTLYEMGVDGVITDFPDIALGILKKFQN
jgi:glycerophosphoryl diester phosphodiesterase